MRGMVRAVCAAKLVTAHCSSPREEQERRVAAGHTAFFFAFFFAFFQNGESGLRSPYLPYAKRAIYQLI